MSVEAWVTSALGFLGLLFTGIGLRRSILSSTRADHERAQERHANEIRDAKEEVRQQYLGTIADLRRQLEDKDDWMRDIVAEKNAAIATKAAEVAAERLRADTLQSFINDRLGRGNYG